MTDEELVDRILAGEKPALDELYRRYAKKLHVFFSRVMRARNPEDLVHDVFVRVIEKGHQFDGRKASFQTWLFRIARNHSINAYRRGKILRFVSIDEPVGPPREHAPGPTLQDVLADPGPGPEGSPLVVAVRECLGELRPGPEREALVLYHILGKNYREIGEILHKSTSAVRKKILAAGEKVRRCLERKGVTSPSPA
jgi:RNA polymerase sigma-70 factor (ECF subfamily)